MEFVLAGVVCFGEVLSMLCGFRSIDWWQIFDTDVVSHRDRIGEISS